LTSLHSRLNLQTFSIDYTRNDCRLGPETLFSWEVGAELQVVFFDTQELGTEMFAHARNYFFGAGPHAGFSLTEALGEGLSCFARVNAALVVGYNTVQDFDVVLRSPARGVLSGSASQQETKISPTFSIQAGLEWCPSWLPGCHCRGGYQFEQWYNLGRVGGSSGDLYTHGLFLGCELSF
jgi:hypothetical protein